MSGAAKITAKTCKYWLQGQCNKADYCTFDHPLSLKGVGVEYRGSGKMVQYDFNEESIAKDLKELPEWKLTCYGPARLEPTIIGHDMSPEEARVMYYRHRNSPDSYNAVRSHIGYVQNLEAKATDIYKSALRTIDNLTSRAREAHRARIMEEEKAAKAAAAAASAAPVSSAFWPSGHGPPIQQQPVTNTPPMQSAFGPAGHGPPVQSAFGPSGHGPPVQSAFGPAGHGPPVQSAFGPAVHGPPVQSAFGAAIPQRSLSTPPSAFGPGGHGPPVQQQPATSTPPMQSAFGPAGHGPPVQSAFGPSGHGPPVQSAFGPAGHGPPVQSAFGPTGHGPPVQSAFGPAGHGPPVQQQQTMSTTQATLPSAFGPAGHGPPVQSAFGPAGHDPPVQSAFGIAGHGPPVQQPTVTTAQQPVQSAFGPSVRGPPVPSAFSTPFSQPPAASAAAQTQSATSTMSLPPQPKAPPTEPAANRQAPNPAAFATTPVPPAPTGNVRAYNAEKLTIPLVDPSRWRKLIPPTIINAEGQEVPRPTYAEMRASKRRPAPVDLLNPGKENLVDPGTPVPPLPPTSQWHKAKRPVVPDPLAPHYWEMAAEFRAAYDAEEFEIGKIPPCPPPVERR